MLPSGSVLDKSRNRKVKLPEIHLDGYGVYQALVAQRQVSHGRTRQMTSIQTSSYKYLSSASW
jgi:hypothetical protein